MVSPIVKSSIPNVPPRHLNLATIRRINAIHAMTRPMTPAYETALVLSRTGAPHAVDVTFFVAIESVTLLGEESTCNILNDSLVVQLDTTHSCKRAVKVSSVHWHVWSARVQDVFGIVTAMHFTYKRSVSQPRGSEHIAYRTCGQQCPQLFHTSSRYSR